MDKKQEIFEAAERIIRMKKAEWSRTELCILIQSQYYNIEDLFTLGANYNENDVETRINISQEIISICKSFYYNLESYPSMFSWDGKEHQIERVDGIMAEVSESFQMLNILKKFQDDPSPFNAMQLKMLGNK